MAMTYELQQEEYLPIEYRLGVETDIPYVANSWFLGNRNNHFNGFIDNAVYEVEQTKIIQKLLGQSQIFVANLEDQPNVIIAYQVYQYLGDKCFLHWMNTKGESNMFRGKGVQSRLLDMINPDNKFQLVITSFPRKDKLFEHLRYKYDAIFDPYFIMRLV
jgi:hypothetical protein